MPHRNFLTSLLFLLFLTGCASTEVKTNQPYTQQLPQKPEQILVYNFTTSPDAIKLNRAMTAKLAQTFSRKTLAEQKQRLGQVVASNISKELVKDLQAMNLPASYAKSKVLTKNTLIITGEVINIDQGNRVERMLLGFGLGRSKIQIKLQIYDTNIPQQPLVAEYLVTTQSSARKPGIAEMTAAGVLAGPFIIPLAASTSLNTTAEAFSTRVEDTAQIAAAKLAQELKPFFIQQGLIPPSAL